MKIIMKKLLLVLAIAISSSMAVSAPKHKSSTQTSKSLCAEDVCLKFKQQANTALFEAKMDVILLGEEEYQKKIPSAAGAMMEKTKAAREEIRPLYNAALASVSSSKEATMAVKEYMKIWTAAINSFPMQTIKSSAQREKEFQSYEARLNEAWAHIQIEAGI